MKTLKMKLYLVFTIVLTSFYTYAGIYVGNGGDAINTNAGLCIVDLYKGDKCTAAHFGTHAQEPLVLLNFHKLTDLISTRILRSLFTNKYLDLELIHNGLGRSFLDSFGYFNWRFVPEFDESTEEDLSESRLNTIRIAVRRGSTIYIHESRWSKLNDEQKIVLLFHEIISALLQLTPDPANPMVKKVDLQLTRSITADLFSRKPAANITNYLEKNILKLNRTTLNNTIRVDIFQQNTDKILQVHSQGPNQEPFRFPHLRLFALGVCKDASALASGDTLKLRIRATYQKKNLAYRIYCSRFGRQTQIEAIPPTVLDFTLHIPATSCSSLLSNVLEDKLQEDLQIDVIKDESLSACLPNLDS